MNSIRNHPPIQSTDSETGPAAQWIHERLRAHVEQESGPARREALVLFCQEDSGSYLGGLRGYFHWSWLYVNYLWVEDEFRSSGLGADLLIAAEQAATAKNAKGIYVDTFSPRARKFYLRCGFEEFAQIPDFPEGQTRFFLKKVLR